MTAGREPPVSLTSLNARINNLVTAQQRPLRRVQRAVANTVVGQMIPLGGGQGRNRDQVACWRGAQPLYTGLRSGKASGVGCGAVHRSSAGGLADGWGGFTATVQEVQGVRPEGVPEPYVMVPYRIMLAYRSRHLLSVTFELGHDEVGSTDHYELRIASYIVDLFEDLGLETPNPSR
jgi:hypothetical protein